MIYYSGMEGMGNIFFLTEFNDFGARVHTITQCILDQSIYLGQENAFQLQIDYLFSQRQILKYDLHNEFGIRFR